MESGIGGEIVRDLPVAQQALRSLGVEVTPMAASTEPRSAAAPIFERVKAQVKARLGQEVYASWFGRMKLAEASKGVVRLSVPTAFLRSWINGHYLDLLADLWREQDPDLLRIEIVVRSPVRLDDHHETHMTLLCDGG